MSFQCRSLTHKANEPSIMADTQQKDEEGKGEREGGGCGSAIVFGPCVRELSFSSSHHDTSFVLMTLVKAIGIHK